MNKFSLILTLALTVLVLGWNQAEAQTFGGGIPVTGNTNAVLQNSGVPQTNFWALSIPSKSLTLSGISSTNETAIGYYAFQIPPTWALAPGSTNIYIVGTFTNSFAAGTNSGTWTTNIPAVFYPINSGTYMGLEIGNYTNTAYVP